MERVPDLSLNDESFTELMARTFWKNAENSTKGNALVFTHSDRASC